MSVHAFYFCDNSIFSSLLVFCEDLHASTHRRQLVTTTADFSTACLSYDFLPKLRLKFTPSPILLFIYYAKKKKRISHSKSTTNARRKKFFLSARNQKFQTANNQIQLYNNNNNYCYYYYYYHTSSTSSSSSSLNVDTHTYTYIRRKKKQPTF